MLKSLIKLGIQPTLTTYKRDRIYLSNILAVFLIVLGVAYFIISIIFVPKAAILPLIGGTLSGISVFVLNSLKLYNFSRILVSISPATLAALYQAFIVQTNEPVIVSICFSVVAFTLFTFMVFDIRESRLLYPLMIYIVALIAFQERLNQWIDIEMSSEVFRHPLMEIISYCTGAAIMFFCLISFQKRNLETETENNNLIKALEKQKAEISTQNEELHQQREELTSQRDFIEQKNIELNNKNLLINTSIRTAQEIQNAVLPAEDEFKSWFKDYFIIFKPRDIVSGDFYWFTTQEDTAWLVAADCTGHGVPGAFTTLLGKNLLDRIINIYGVSNPAEALKILDFEIQKVLRQKETGNTSGMDLAMLKLTKLKNGNSKIVFAGAKSPLYYYLPNSSEQLELASDRVGIGGIKSKEIKFTNHEIELPSESLFFIASDGFQDQNDINRKSFKRKRLKALITKNIHSPLDQQKELIENVLNNFMKGAEQRDDILLMGFKI